MNSPMPSASQTDGPRFLFVAGIPENAITCTFCGARQTWHYFKQVQDAARIAERFKREHRCAAVPGGQLPVAGCQQEGIAA